MAEEKIGYQDFFDKELFNPVIENLKQLLEALNELEKAFKGDAKKAVEELVKVLATMKNASDVSASSLREVATKAANVGKAKENIDALANAKEKLKNQVKTLTSALSEEGKEYVRLQGAVRKLRGDMRDLAKAEERRLELAEALEKVNAISFESYKDLSKTLEALRSRVKDLAAANQTNTEEFRTLSRVVIELDERVKAIDTAFGQYQRLVGSYKESIVQAFSEITASAIGVEGTLGKFSVLLIDIVANSYKAQGGIRGLSSAITLLGKGLKSLGIIALLELLVEAISRLRKALFPTGEEKLYTLELSLQNELIQKRIVLLNSMLDKQAELAELSGDDLTTVLKRLEVQQKLVDLQILEVEAQKAALDAQIAYREEALKTASQSKEQLGFIGRALAFLNDLESKILGSYSKTLGKIVHDINEQILDFLAKYFGNKDAVLEAEAELAKSIEQRLKLEEQIIALQSEQKRIQKEILDIRANALSEALNRLLDVEEKATTKASEIVRRFQEATKDLEKSFQEALDKLGTGFTAERLILQKEFQRRKELLRAQFQSELAETANQYILQAANVVRDTLPAISGYVKAATEVIVAEQAKTIDALIKETEDFIRVLQAEAEANKENAESLLAQAENAKVFLSALQKIRQTIQLNSVAEFVRRDLEAIRDSWKAQDAELKKVLDLIQLEVIERKAAFSEKERLLEQEKLQNQQRLSLFGLFSKAKLISERQLLDKEKALELERLDFERQIEERRTELQKAQLERRKAELQKQLDILKAEIAKYAEDAIPAQIQRLASDIQAEIAGLDNAILQLNVRSAEVAQNYLDKTASLAISYAKRYAEIARKEAQELLQATEVVLENINKVIDQKSERRRKSLETQKDTIDRTIDVLVARAEAGSLAADQSISELLERKKQIELQEQEIRRQQQRRELLLTALQAYSAAIQRGSQSPLADTIRDLTALSQLIQALPTFYTGSEYVSSANAVKIPNFTKDAFLARLHEGERVVPADINKKLGGIRNEDLPDIINKTKEVSFDVDSLRRALITIVKEKNTTNRYIDRL